MNKTFFGVTLVLLALVAGKQIESRFFLTHPITTHEHIRFVPAEALTATKNKLDVTPGRSKSQATVVPGSPLSNAELPVTIAEELKAAATLRHEIAHQDNVISESPIIGGSVVHVKREEYLKSLIAEGADPILIQNAEDEEGDVTIVKTEPGVAQLAANEVQIQGCNLAALVQKPVVLSVSAQGEVVGSSQLDTDSTPLPNQILKDCHILASQGRQFQFVTVINPIAE